MASANSCDSFTLKTDSWGEANLTATGCRLADGSKNQQTVSISIAELIVANQKWRSPGIATHDGYLILQESQTKPVHFSDSGELGGFCGNVKNATSGGGVANAGVGDYVEDAGVGDYVEDAGQCGGVQHAGVADYVEDGT